MLQYIINGGIPLRGKVRLQGAKNSVLPILAAAVLGVDSQLDNCPYLKDVDTSLRILNDLGCEVSRNVHTILVSASGAESAVISRSLCQQMRSSILYLGPLLARFREAQIYLPGGCLLGSRPIDLHISALERMGACIEIIEDEIRACCPNGLHGAEITLPFPSVGVTETVMMSAVLAKGTTILRNSAIEPEIEDLADFLNRMGGKVNCSGRTVTIEGVTELHSCQKLIIPDRIVAFTYMAAALVTDGEITIENCNREHLKAPLEFLAMAGGAFSWKDDEVTVRRGGKFLLPTERIVTAPYPGFPTDDGAVAMAMLSLAQGRSEFFETVFSDRFGIVKHLKRLGADIITNGGLAEIYGTPCLCGNKVCATDLRAGAALIVAGLSAVGTTVVTGAHHILRGYETIDQTLRTLGANIILLENERGM